MIMGVKSLAVVSELDRYIAEVNRFPLLSADQERELAVRWREEGDVAAAHALVCANLRFVVKISMEYKGYGARPLDLIQEGSIGLMNAVKRFDPERGYRLLTYAVYWIRSYIHSFLMGTARMIKIGTSRAHRKLFFKLRSLKGKLSARGITGQEEVYDAVSLETGVGRAEVEEMDRHLLGRDASIDAPVGDTGAALVDVLPDDGPTQEERLAQLEEQADQVARIDQALSVLDPRERKIVEWRYLQEEPVQLKELGEHLGVTKQRVAQLEKRALEKLRLALAA
jgi:RNA polymerase sigma-32 factor